MTFHEDMTGAAGAAGQAGHAPIDAIEKTRRRDTHGMPGIRHTKFDADPSRPPPTTSEVARPWDPETEGPGSVTVVMQAAGAGKVGSLQMLLEERAHMDRIDTRDPAGQTALHWAAKVGSADCAQLLLQRGARQDVFNINGRSPLHFACANVRAGWSRDE